MAAVFAGDAKTCTGTDLRHFVRPGHGKQLRCYFCPQCGTRLYRQWFTEERDYPFPGVKPGTLDDTSWLRPDCHVWAQHAQPWIRFTDDDVVFAAQPSLDDMPKFSGTSGDER